MTKKYTEAELRQASDHLFYEIWMANKLAEILEKSPGGAFTVRPVAHTDSMQTARFLRSTGVTKSSETNPEEEEFRVINNALIESFAIHVRALIDFFYTPEKEDDVVAVHFFSTQTEWTKARPRKTEEELKRIKNRVNKEVAHLTYARQTVKTKEWPFKELLTDMNKVVDVFVAQVPKDLLGSRWK